jgi:hypothetical protein
MRTVIILILSFLSSACAKNVDYSQPHEYIDWVSATDGYATMDESENSYSGTGVVPTRNWFPRGEGQCLQFLKKIGPKQANISMQAFNYYLSSSGHYNEKRIRHVRYRCIEYNGEIEGCRERIIDVTEKYVYQNNLGDWESVAAYLQADIAADKKCKIKRTLGETQIFHHAGYENDSPQ